MILILFYMLNCMTIYYVEIWTSFNIKIGMTRCVVSLKIGGQSIILLNSKINISCPCSRQYSFALISAILQKGKNEIKS